MLHPARLITFAVVFILGLVVRGAVGDLGDSATVGSEPVSKAAIHNQPVVEGLTLRWQQIPDVLDAHAGYLERGATGHVTAYAVCRRCTLKALAGRLTRDVWTSDLVHVTNFTVNVALEGKANKPLTLTYDPVKDAARLYDRWGNGLVDPDTASQGS